MGIVTRSEKMESTGKVVKKNQVEEEEEEKENETTMKKSSDDRNDGGEEEAVYDSPISPNVPVRFHYSNGIPTNENMSYNDDIDEDYDGEYHNDDEGIGRHFDQSQSIQQMLTNARPEQIPFPPPRPPPPPPPPHTPPMQLLYNNDNAATPYMYDYNQHYYPAGPSSQNYSIHTQYPSRLMFPCYPPEQISANGNNIIQNMGQFAAFQPPLPIQPTSQQQIPQLQPLTETFVVGKEQEQNHKHILKEVTCFRREDVVNVLDAIDDKLERVRMALDDKSRETRRNDEDDSHNASDSEDMEKTKKGNNKKRRTISPIRIPSSTKQQESQASQENGMDVYSRQPPKKKQRTTAHNNDEEINNIDVTKKDLSAFMTDITNSYNYYYLGRLSGINLKEYNKSDELNNADIHNMILFHNKINDHYMNKGEGNVFQVECFSCVETIKLHRKGYLERVCEIIEDSKRYPKNPNFNHDKELASMNVVYYRSNLSYVYADYYFKNNTYKVGIVDKNREITYIGEIAPKLLYMIMLRNIKPLQ